MEHCLFFVIMPSVNDRQSFSNKERLLPNCLIDVDMLVKATKMHHTRKEEKRFAIA